MFVLTNDNDGMTDEELTMLDNLPFKNVLAFTARAMPQHRCAFQLKQFAGEKEVGNTMLKSIWTGEMAAQKEFDFTARFNQERGYNLEAYRK